MSRTSLRDRSFMILEGDDDRRFWLSFVDSQRCELIPAYGKKNVVECIRRVDAHPLPGVLGVVDADLDALAGAPPIASSNIISTEDYDLEALLFQSSAFRRVLAEHGDPKRIARFEESAGHDVRDALVSRALPFARLRLLSVRRTIDITIKKFHPHGYINKMDWSLAVDALHDEAARQGRLARSRLHEHLDDLPAVTPWALCNGHEVLEILRIGLEGILGPPGRPSIRPEQLAGLLRQGLQLHEFQASTLYRDLRAWEARSAPYCVLP